MDTNETSYALQALEADPQFILHLIGALSVSHEDWLEALALRYLENRDAWRSQFEEKEMASIHDDDDQPWDGIGRAKYLRMICENPLTSPSK